MAKDIFVGVDGGGTKTKIRIEDSLRNLLGEAVSGAANIRLSVKESWQSVLSGIKQALKNTPVKINNKNYCFHAGMGLAGTELPEACEEFLKTPHIFKTLVLKSDGYTSCIGAHDGKDGAIIAIGTGVVGYQICSGKNTQVGGWGFPHGDEGGGAWLGIEAVRLTLHWQDGRAEGTPLLKVIFNQFNNNLTKLVVWANEADSNKFASIAPFVVKYVEKKDPWALMLIKRGAEQVDNMALSLSKAAGRKSLPCSLLGGIAPFIEPWLNEELKSRLVPCRHDAVMGALFMIRKKILGHI